MPPSKLGLRPGSSIRLEDAILALATKSANDVAVVVAEALGGTESQFAEMMTRKARALGMTRTTFRNASGLHNKQQMSTARDMARLARALMHDFPHYYHYFSVTEFRYAGHTYRNHNHLLSAYNGMDGLKTGYTGPSGFNLAASAVRNGRRLIAVVFGGRTARTRDQHMATLLDDGFTRLTVVAAAAPDIVPSPPNPRREILLAAVDESELVDAIPPAPLKPAAVTVDPAELKAAIEIANAELEGEILQAAAEAVGSADEPEAAAPAAGASLDPYAVQVGAYYDAALARRAATRAVERVPHLLVDTEVDISRTQGQRGWIYRGRLVGLTLGRAREACHALRSVKQDCLVVRTSDGVEVALN